MEENFICFGSKILFTVLCKVSYSSSLSLSRESTCIIYRIPNYFSFKFSVSVKYQTCIIIDFEQCPTTKHCQT